MVVGYLPEDQLCNYTDGVENVNPHSSFQIHLDTPCSRLEEFEVP
jgi:hypothetical protein